MFDFRSFFAMFLSGTCSVIGVLIFSNAFGPDGAGVGAICGGVFGLFVVVVYSFASYR